MTSKAIRDECTKAVLPYGVARGFVRHGADVVGIFAIIPLFRGSDSISHMVVDSLKALLDPTVLISFLRSRLQVLKSKI